MLDGRTILITGGTGSIGTILVRRLISGQYGTPSKLIVFSRDEAKQAEMRRAHRAARTELEFRIGDVRDIQDVSRALQGVDVVIHAAALKQVPTCEYFPSQAVLTNVIGATNIVEAVLAGNGHVETVVGVSTDKACRPVSAMGMSKALQERVFAAANLHSDGTRFVCVRFGNVLASRGSVVPLFLDQIRKGTALTVTVPEMTRFLLTLDEAVDAVAAAIRWGRSGETIVPRAPSATILNVAQALIGSRPIPIHVIGARPGEKLHEVLVCEEEVPRCTERHGFLFIRSMLPELVSHGDEPAALIKEYSSADEVLDYEGTVSILQSSGLVPAHEARQ